MSLIDKTVKLRALANARREYVRYTLDPDNRDGWYQLYTDEQRQEELDAADFYDSVADELERMNALLNTPELLDFSEGTRLEALHQRERWGSNHDAGKTPFDWFWLVGYLAQKAASAQVAGDLEKALHHCISTAAAMANWHEAIRGTSTVTRPGLAGEVQQSIAPSSR